MSSLRAHVQAVVLAGWAIGLLGCSPPPSSSGSRADGAGAALQAASGPGAGESPSAGAERRSGPPNIIFILTDDQAPGTLGCEGNRVIRTPNIDRLAADGVRFTRAYVTLPQCAPSRASILTGRYPSAIGALSNNDARLPENTPTLAQALKQRGYRCGLIGKWHQGDPLKPQAGFEDFWVARDKNARSKSEKHIDPVLFVNGETGVHKGYLTDVLTDHALGFIEQNAAAEQPFFLWLAHYAPHEPFDAHPDPKLQYSPEEVPLPENMRDDLTTKPPQQRASDCHKWFRQRGEGKLRRQIAEYYSMISAIDMSVGRVREKLTALGIERDTLIVYMSDNGWLNGEHQLERKGPMFYEELVRTPLIFCGAGVPAGQLRTALVSAVDLFPTLSAAAGATAPKGPGHDLWPMIRSADARGHEAVYLQFYEKGSTGDIEPMLGVVTEQYKYSRYMHGGDEELYDLQADPLELINLRHASSAAAPLGALRLRLNEFAATIQPPFWKPE